MTNLIPIAYLNEVCFLSLNTDDKKYKAALDEAQDDLLEILGGQFYEQIVTQYSTNPTSFSADNETIYEDYIKKYLAWQTYINYLGFANNDSTPTGIRKFNDENSELLSGVEMYALEKKINGKVEKYKGKMINFLRLEQQKDSTKYPLYHYQCKESFSFGITSVTKKDYTLFKANKSITNNE